MSKCYKSDEEWKKLLDQESYRVTRQAGTERPFTGKFWDFNKDGIYKCICCGTNLFESDVPPETRVLVDQYTDSEELSINHNIMMIDIEVEVTEGFPMPEDANNKITSNVFSCG